jgi:hypothetical protein
MDTILTVLKFAAIVRAVFYLYVATESLFLGFLYWNAYKKFKTTPIIKALERLLFSIGITFFFMTLVALISFIDSMDIYYNIMVALIPVFTIPLLVSLMKFREKSTDEIPKKGQYLVKSYKFQKKQ